MKAQGFTKETIKNMGISDRGFPAFSIGDTVEVGIRIKEDKNKERVQLFKGDVIAIKKNGVASTFTVRKIGANKIAVERILPLYSPIIASLKVTRKGKVRRAKLYYIRDRVGKAARITEDRKKSTSSAKTKKAPAVKEESAPVAEKTVTKEKAPSSEETKS